MTAAPRDAPRDRGVELMLAWQAGDESAFDRLVEAYSGRAYALCTRFLGEVAGREDLVQEAFLRVLRARHRYRPEARFSTWLYRIVYNLCANARERAREVASLDAGAGEPGSAGDARGPGAGGAGRRAGGGRPSSELADDAAPDPAEGLARGDVASAVRAAVASLPESQRMALILSKYEELSHAEIAAVLDTTEKAVKSLVHRARESLRRRLAPWMEEELS